MSAVVKPLLVQRRLDCMTLDQIERILMRVRMDLVQARLYARGNTQAQGTIDTAGVAVRAALDVFVNAHNRGGME